MSQGKFSDVTGFSAARARRSSLFVILLPWLLHERQGDVEKSANSRKAREDGNGYGAKVLFPR